MSEFSLRDLVDEVRQDCGPNPEDIAEKVEPRIPEQHRHGVFLALLTRYIRETRPRLANAFGPPRIPAVAEASASRKPARAVEDKDGEVRGFGFDPDDPDVIRIGMLVLRLKCGDSAHGDGCCLEHDAEKDLRRKLRRHPLGAWVKVTKGVGEKQAARLLAAIGDPYIRPEWTKPDGTVVPEGPRTVSALWAYCGMHVLPAGHGRFDDQVTLADRALPDQMHNDVHGIVVGDGGDPGQVRIGAHRADAGVAAKRRKGTQANWSTKAKMRAYLIAESCMKTGKCQTCRDGHLTGDAQRTSAVPVADTQDRDGQRTDDTQHTGAVAACACSPYRVVYDKRRAHTAVTHPDWPDGHSHNDGLRIAAKEILKDLWREAKRIHESNTPGQTTPDDQLASAGGVS